MARYMSQDLFTTLVVRLSWMQKLHVHDVSRRKRAIDTALLKYRKFFTDDAFEIELWPTTDAFDQWLADVYPNPPEQMAWMNALRGALERFDPSGTPKRQPLFSGLWYTSARSQPVDRMQICLRDIARCHRSLQLGRISL
jgi:hypothetical protein